MTVTLCSRSPHSRSSTVPGAKLMSRGRGPQLDLGMIAQDFLTPWSHRNYGLAWLRRSVSTSGSARRCLEAVILVKQLRTLVQGMNQQGTNARVLRHVQPPG